MDFEDREPLGKYLRDDYQNLMESIVHCQTVDEFSAYLNERIPKTLSSDTLSVCSQLLFNILKIPPPLLAIDIVVHALSIQLDSQHVIYLSDIIASFSERTKPDDVKIESVELKSNEVNCIESGHNGLECTESDKTMIEPSNQSSSPAHSSFLLATFLAYHIFSSYPTFIITLLMIISFPFWLYSAFLQALGGLLCLGSGLLYLNRWVIDQSEAKSRRKDCQRDSHSTTLQLHLQTEEITLQLTTTEFSSTETIVSNVLALRINTLESNVHVDKQKLTIDVQIQALALEDLMTTPSSYLVCSSTEHTWEMMKQRASPFLSIHFLSCSSPSSEENHGSSQLISIKLDPTISRISQ